MWENRMPKKFKKKKKKKTKFKQVSNFNLKNWKIEKKNQEMKMKTYIKQANNIN